MLWYIYDGSFSGLLTAIYESYYRRQIPEAIMVEEARQNALFTEQVIIPTDEEKADKVYIAICEKISRCALHNVYCVFLAQLPESEMLIYYYLGLGFKLGAKVDSHLGDKRIFQVHQVAKKVRFEAHRMLGLIRFRQLKNELYYAEIEPDHNILELVAPHFTRRMANQNWLIHDVKRGLAAIYNQREWAIMPLTGQENLPVSETENLYQSLWQQYFSSIAITSRTNPILQKRCMPKRYWKYLTELTNLE